MKYNDIKSLCFNIKKYIDIKIIDLGFFGLTLTMCFMDTILSFRNENPE